MPKETILRLPEILRRLSISRSSFCTLLNEKQFAHPISLRGRSVGWLESDLTEFITSRLIASGRIPKPFNSSNEATHSDGILTLSSSKVRNAESYAAHAPTDIFATEKRKSQMTKSKKLRSMKGN